jgi:hypothetical protein
MPAQVFMMCAPGPALQLAAAQKATWATALRMPHVERSMRFLPDTLRPADHDSLAKVALSLPMQSGSRCLLKVPAALYGMVHLSA